MSGAIRECESRSSEGLRHARDRTDVPGLLDAIEVEIDGTVTARQVPAAAPRQSAHGEHALLAVGIAQTGEDALLDQQRRLRQPIEKGDSCGPLRELRSDQNGLERKPRAQRLFEQVRPFEERVVALPSPERANILDDLILPTPDHDSAS